MGSDKKAALSAYEKHVTVQVHRSMLKNAPYNPRVLSDKSRDKLKRSLKKFGLVEPPVWNKRTGHLVGGHQRLSVLDALEKSGDYLLTVAQVDLEEKDEKALNVMLNNTTAQGDFDLGKLGDVLKDCDIEDAGFDAADVYQLFGDDFMAAQQEEALAELTEQVRVMQERYKTVKEKKLAARDEVNFYTVLIFKDGEAREEFAKLMGVEDNKWMDGAWVVKKLHQGKEDATS